MIYNIKTIALQLLLEDEDGCTYEDCENYIKEGNYVVYTNEEANNAVVEYIKEAIWSFRPDFLACYIDLPVEDIKILCSLYENANNILISLLKDKLDELVKDAIELDGRGHFLSNYDGKEHKITINLTTSEGTDDFTLYIYRCY